MAARVLTDCCIYVAGYDFTTDVNEATLDSSADVKDKTTFGSGGWREKINGLRTVNMKHSGFWQSAASGAVDPEAFPALGVADQVCTFGVLETTPADPTPLTDEHIAYFFRGGKFAYKLFDGGVGEIYPFTLDTQNTNAAGMIKGYLTCPKTTVNATGKVGAAFDTAFGIASGQSLYATFHVFTAGTTITVQMQSDDNVGFTTPTTLATIGPLTTAGGTWMTPVAGPITDRYFRFNVSAITGTFTVAAALGGR